MNPLIYLVIFITSIIVSCSTANKIPGKFTPEWAGVDKRVLYIYDEFKWLSRQNNITFKQPISIGFKNIDSGLVVGVCHYGSSFREIDIDISYWNRSTNLQKIALVYHELAHCYCGRGHTYKDASYKDNDIAEAIKAFFMGKKMHKESGEGFYEDQCPKSLMYPSVVPHYCMAKHYQDYVQEMFEGCDPF